MRYHRAASFAFARLRLLNSASPLRAGLLPVCPRASERAGEGAKTPSSGATGADPLCSHTCLCPPHFLRFQLLPPSQPSLCFFSTLSSLHSPASASTQVSVSSLQPSQEDCFMLSVLFPPDTSEGAWAVLWLWAVGWGGSAVPRGSFLPPSSCSGGCRPLPSGPNKCLGDS